MGQTAVSYSGNVAFTAIDPQGPNPAAGLCVAATSSRVYEINFGMGGRGSVRTTAIGGGCVYALTSEMTDLMFMRAARGQVSLIGGSSDGKITHIHAEGGTCEEGGGCHAVSASASPSALTSRSISASVLMNGGANWIVSPP